MLPFRNDREDEVNEVSYKVFPNDSVGRVGNCDRSERGRKARTGLFRNQRNVCFTEGLIIKGF